MSGAYNLPDYRARFFEYKELSKIHGEPTVDSIVTLLRQVKRNAQRVTTTLGGGQLGYLALVIPPMIYNTIPGSAPFIRPTDPGTFAPINALGVRAAPLTPGDIAAQKIAFDESKRQFNECQAVEVALRNQIIEAIDPDYLQPLRNAVTEMLNDSIPDIFTFLTDTYGQLSPSDLKLREKIVDEMVYDPAQGIDTVFNCIQEFQDLCALLANPKTDTQLVTYAFLIFQRNTIFMTSLKEWNKKLAGMKTFNNFKIFMRSQYRELKAVGGLTVQNSAFNMMEEIKSHQQDLSHNLKAEIREGILQTLHAFNMQNVQNQENIPPVCNQNQQMAESHYNLQGYAPIQQTQAQMTTQENMFAMNKQPDPTITLLLQQMKLMEERIVNLTLTNQNSANLQTNQNSANFQNKKGAIVSSDVNPKTGLPWKRYCWSCGCCAHWGRNCPVKKRGHQDDATFKTRKGGSNDNCK